MIRYATALLMAVGIGYVACAGNFGGLYLLAVGVGALAAFGLGYRLLSRHGLGRRLLVLTGAVGVLAVSLVLVPYLDKPSTIVDAPWVAAGGGFNDFVAGDHVYFFGGTRDVTVLQHATGEVMRLPEGRSSRLMVDARERMYVVDESGEGATKRLSDAGEALWSASGVAIAAGDTAVVMESCTADGRRCRYQAVNSDTGKGLWAKQLSPVAFGTEQAWIPSGFLSRGPFLPELFAADVGGSRRLSILDTNGRAVRSGLTVAPTIVADLAVVTMLVDGGVQYSGFREGKQVWTHRHRAVRISMPAASPAGHRLPRR